METLQDLISQHQTALYEPNKILTEIKSKLKDKSIPLEERWECYLKVEEYLEIDNFYISIPDMDGEEITYYDHLYCDKYATKQCSIIVENLEDYSEEAVNNLKEHLLQTGYGGCINDW